MKEEPLAAAAHADKGGAACCGSTGRQARRIMDRRGRVDQPRRIGRTLLAAGRGQRSPRRAPARVRRGAAESRAED